MQDKILLAGGAWRPRALVLAQLVEERYEVTAVETWDEAELLLRTRAVTPAVVVFDLEAEQHPEAALLTLARLADPRRVVVLTARSQLPPCDVRAKGVPHVLARPYSVGDVVATVAAIVAPDQRPATRD